MIGRTIELLPEPQPEEHRYDVISVDDHVTEPPPVFEGRIEAKYADRAPRLAEDESGGLIWAYEDGEMHDAGLSAAAGRPQSALGFEPIRYEEIREGCWDIHARVRDMDLDGVVASVTFPSMCGFAGRKFSASKDPGLGLACVRADNCWHLEEWASAYPGRVIPMQLAWQPDPKIAAREVERNAERGFRAVTFRDILQRLGYPSINEPVWDPFLQACQDKKTVICLHTDSAGSVLSTGKMLRFSSRRRSSLAGRSWRRWSGSGHSCRLRGRIGTYLLRTCCGGTSGSACRTTHRRCRPWIASEQTTSCSRLTTRTQTLLGHTPKACSLGVWRAWTTLLPGR
jgi:Amidohydrolase